MIRLLQLLVRPFAVVAAVFWSEFCDNKDIVRDDRDDWERRRWAAGYTRDKWGQLCVPPAPRTPPAEGPPPAPG